MKLKAHMEALFGNVDVTIRLPERGTARGVVIPAVIHHRVDQALGSSLSTHVLAGTMGTPAAMYLKGEPEEVVCAVINANLPEGSKPISVKSMWTGACKLITAISEQAILDAFNRQIPANVKQRNMLFNTMDVLDLPDIICVQALKLAEADVDYVEHKASLDMAAVLALVVLRLLAVETEEEKSPLGLNIQRKLHNELVGATVLSILDVCPEDRNPAELVNKLLEKRTAELKKLSD